MQEKRWQIYGAEENKFKRWLDVEISALKGGVTSALFKDTVDNTKRGKN